MTSFRDGIGITDLDWFQSLHDLPATPGKVNFWTPTPSWPLRNLGPGSKWYFMLKAPIRKIGGYGTVIDSYKRMTISEAWERFGTGNGVASIDELIDRTHRYAQQRSEKHQREVKHLGSDHEIGCIVLENTEFWEASEYRDPELYLDTSVPNQVVMFKFVGSPASKLPNELDKRELRSYPEGAKKQIIVNAYERNNYAREKCLEHYGYECRTCTFDFEAKYGEQGKEFIHVHHVVPISSIGQNYQVDPIQDLIPVCPNCHAMIHRYRKNTLTVDELKKILNQTASTV